jgi:DNA recombination protein RmuC
MIPVFVILSALAGVVAGWVLAAWRLKSSEGRLESELRGQLQAREVELEAARARETLLIADKASAVTARDATVAQLAESRAEGEGVRHQLDEVRERLSVETSGRSRVAAELDAARNLLADRQALYERQLAEARAAQDKAIAELREAFQALSAEALTRQAPEFLRMAGQAFARLQETAKGDLSRREEAIAGLLKPLEEQLRTYQQRLQQTETLQSSALGEVRKQLETLNLQSESLANETERFRLVLRSSQARGRWGEETLRRVVEAAGMSVHCDFIEQTVEEDKKPDMIVKLPGDRLIIVDAKVPDLDFLAALDSADPGKRSQLLQAHARKLKDTIRSLGDRDYPSQFANALDYVVLFLPAESLFSAALEGDNELIVWAASRRIMLATPASLIALLRSVSITWQQYAQTENARAIAETAQELYGRVAKFTEHFERIRGGLVRANEAFNDAVGSYERMVRPCGDRLVKLGLDTSGKMLTDVTATDAVLRLPAGESASA